MQEIQHVAVFDFGSQYTQLIVRRVRELGFFAKLYSPEDIAEIGAPGAIILSGGPKSTSEPGAPDIDFEKLKSFGVPVLGVCYGMQLLNIKFGGTVKASNKRLPMPDGRIEFELETNTTGVYTITVSCVDTNEIIPTTPFEAAMVTGKLSHAGCKAVLQTLTSSTKGFKLDNGFNGAKGDKSKKSPLVCAAMAGEEVRSPREGTYVQLFAPGRAMVLPSASYFLRRGKQTQSSDGTR